MCGEDAGASDMCPLTPDGFRARRHHPGVSP